MIRFKPHSKFEGALLKRGIERYDIAKALGIDWKNPKSMSEKNMMTLYGNIMKGAYEKMSLRDVDSLAILANLPISHISGMIKIWEKTIEDMTEEEITAYVRISTDLRR